MAGNIDHKTCVPVPDKVRGSAIHTHTTTGTPLIMLSSTVKLSTSHDPMDVDEYKGRQESQSIVVSPGTGP